MGLRRETEVVAHMLPGRSCSPFYSISHFRFNQDGNIPGTSAPLPTFFLLFVICHHYCHKCQIFRLCNTAKYRRRPSLEDNLELPCVATFWASDFPIDFLECVLSATWTFHRFAHLVHRILENPFRIQQKHPNPFHDFPAFFCRMSLDQTIQFPKRLLQSLSSVASGEVEFDFRSFVLVKFCHVRSPARRLKGISETCYLGQGLAGGELREAWIRKSSITPENTVIDRDNDYTGYA